MWRIKRKRSLLYASQKSPSREKTKSRKFTLNTGTCMAWEDISLEGTTYDIVKIKIWPDPPCFHFGRNIAQNFADDHMLVLKSSYYIHFLKNIHPSRFLYTAWSLYIFSWTALQILSSRTQRTLSKITPPSIWNYQLYFFTDKLDCLLTVTCYDLF